MYDQIWFPVVVNLLLIGVASLGFTVIKLLKGIKTIQKTNEDLNHKINGLGYQFNDQIMRINNMINTLHNQIRDNEKDA
jgi:hypothetical protein